MYGLSGDPSFSHFRDHLGLWVKLCTGEVHLSHTTQTFSPSPASSVSSVCWGFIRRQLNSLRAIFPVRICMIREETALFKPLYFERGLRSRVGCSRYKWRQWWWEAHLWSHCFYSGFLEFAKIGVVIKGKVGAGRTSGTTLGADLASASAVSLNTQGPFQLLWSLKISSRRNWHTLVWELVAVRMADWLSAKMRTGNKQQ